MSAWAWTCSRCSAVLMERAANGVLVREVAERLEAHQRDARCRGSLRPVRVPVEQVKEVRA